MKVVPYVLGEAAYWGEDRYAQDVSRLYGRAGVRASVPWWRADPVCPFSQTRLACRRILL